jgi:hypothetical protein
MLLYYPFEHLYYLASKEIIPLSKARINKYSLWSCRAWAVYVCLQFLHLKEDWKLLKRREKALKKDLSATGSEKAISAAEGRALKADLIKRKGAILNELVVNLGYLPLTIHWWALFLHYLV